MLKHIPYVQLELKYAMGDGPIISYMSANGKFVD